MDGPDPRGDEGARPILTGIERGIIGGAGSDVAAGQTGLLEDE